MKYYYEATHHIPYEDEDYIFLCSSDREVQKGDYIVVHLKDGIGFAIAQIAKKVSEIDALTKRIKPVEVIQLADKAKAYEQKLDDLIKINSLRLDMDEMAKEVKAIENFRKLAAQNEKFRELFQAYEHLIKNDDYTASAG